MAASSGDGHTNLVDDLETSFQNCLALITTQEHFNAVDSDETKTGVDHTINKFMDLARQTEAYFLSRRLVMSTEKPEQVLKEDITDLKIELERKDKLIEKHHDHLQQWQNLLRNMPGTGTPQASMHQAPPQMPQPPPPQQMHPQPHPQMGQYPGPPMQAPGPQPFVMPPPQQPPPAYPPGPLAFLEQTMSNIGMPDRR